MCQTERVQVVVLVVDGVLRDEYDAFCSVFERLHDVRPRHLLLCTGTRDPLVPFANDDLPGVVAARGLIRALRRAQARLALGQGARQGRRADAQRLGGGGQAAMVGQGADGAGFAGGQRHGAI